MHSYIVSGQLVVMSAICLVNGSGVSFTAKHWTCAAPSPPGPSSDINQNPAEAVTSGPNPATAMDHAQTDPLSKLGQGKDGVPPL